MAFRRFTQPEVARPARFEGVPNLLQAIQTAGLLKAKERETQAKAQADKIKAINDLELVSPTGGFVSDTKEIYEESKGIHDQFMSDMWKNGYASPETKKAMADLENKATISKQQKEQLTGFRKQVADKQRIDPYYNADLVNAMLTDEGIKGFDRDFANVDINDPSAFMFEKYSADYVKEQSQTWAYARKTDIMEREVEVVGPFLDVRGRVNVTDEDARQFIKSRDDGAIQQYYDQAQDFLLEDEIDQMETLPFPELAWMDGLSKNEIKTRLINNPSLNVINPRSWGERTLLMAKKDLTNKIKINKTVSIDESITDRGAAAGTAGERIAVANAESRFETLNQAVYGGDIASLQAAFGGLKGIKEVKYDIAEAAADDITGPRKGAKVVKVNIPNDAGEDAWTTVPIGTPEEMEKAMITLNKYMDDEVKGTANYIGPDKIKRMMDENVRYTVGEDELSKAELRQMGYTDAQIKEALDLKNISIVE